MSKRVLKAVVLELQQARDVRVKQVTTFLSGLGANLIRLVLLSELLLYPLQKLVDVQQLECSLIHSNENQSQALHKTERQARARCCHDP